MKMISEKPVYAEPPHSEPQRLLHEGYDYVGEAQRVHDDERPQDQHGRVEYQGARQPAHQVVGREEGQQGPQPPGHLRLQLVVL